METFATSKNGRIPMKKTLFSSLLSLSAGIFLLTVAAQADVLKIKPTHPERYTVVKGDTLWDISGRFLEHPWQWPEIWQINPQIDDPHWIYPGDVVELVYINGKPQLRKASGRVVLTPQMRIRDVAEQVRVIPINAIKPVLESGYVVDSETDFGSLPRIVDLSSERLILGDKSSIVKYGAQRQLAGNEQRVFIRGDVTPRGVYDIIRPAEQLKAADSDEILGQTVIKIGELIVARSNDTSADVSAGLVTLSPREVKLGDYLVPHQGIDTAMDFQPKKSSIKDGNVIGFTKPGLLIASMDTVIIDRGQDTGVTRGDVFALSRDGRRINDPKDQTKLQLPEESVGLAMVYKTFGQVSYALVMESYRGIQIGDHLRQP
jgi:hypothetical protein